MSIVEPPIADSEIFARAIAANDALPPEIARSVLEWKIPPKDLRKVSKLQEKNNQGTITPAEHRELASYVRVGELLAVLHARARLSLKENRGKTQR
jgi:hypothetical protein